MLSELGTFEVLAFVFTLLSLLGGLLCEAWRARPGETERSRRDDR
jgi:hypothetical protein